MDTIMLALLNIQFAQDVSDVHWQVKGLHHWPKQLTGTRKMPIAKVVLKATMLFVVIMLGSH